MHIVWLPTCGGLRSSLRLIWACSKFHRKFLWTCEALRVVWTQNTGRWKSFVSILNMAVLFWIKAIHSQLWKVTKPNRPSPNGQKINKWLKLGNTQVNRSWKNVSLRNLFNGLSWEMYHQLWYLEKTENCSRCQKLGTRWRSCTLITLLSFSRRQFTFKLPSWKRFHIIKKILFYLPFSMKNCI